jgi:hypothetical protein
MSQSNQKIRHLSSCSLSTTVPDGAVVIAAGIDEASLRKRKEEASKTLYITRI